MKSVLDVTSASFQKEVLESQEPVLVDFWATWCPPCRRLSPKVEELAEEYKGRLKVAKIDSDSNQDLAARYQIQALPTLLFFKDGQVKASLVGDHQKTAIARQIDTVLVG
jgi:thioredoxin 1